MGFAYDFIQVRGRKVNRTCLIHTLFLHDIVRVHQAQLTSYIELLADISMLDFFLMFSFAITSGFACASFALVSALYSDIFYIF